MAAARAGLGRARGVSRRRRCARRRRSALPASMSARSSAAAGSRGSTPTIIFEELATACVSTAAYLSIHNMAAWMIDRFGDEAQRAPLSAEADVDGAFRQLLPDRAGQRLGRRRAADPRPARRRPLCPERVQGVHLRRRPQRHLCRRWCAPARPGRGASPASSSRTARRASPSASRRKSSAGTRQPTATVIFEDCRVPVANRLGAEGEGFRSR